MTTTGHSEHLLTIQDIANRLGITVRTAFKYVRNMPRVNPAPGTVRFTEERYHELAKERPPRPRPNQHHHPLLPGFQA